MPRGCASLVRAVGISRAAIVPTGELKTRSVVCHELHCAKLAPVLPKAHKKGRPRSAGALFYVLSKSLARLALHRWGNTLFLAHLLAHVAQGVIIELGFVAGFVEAFAVVEQMLHGLVQGAEQLHVVGREKALVAEGAALGGAVGHQIVVKLL